MVLAPPIAGAVLISLKALSLGGLVSLFLPVFWLALFLIGVIPAFLAGMAYVMLLRYRVVSVESSMARVNTGALLGALFAPITGVIAGVAQGGFVSEMHEMGLLAASGAIAGAICTAFLPLKRWRSAF
jgi:hypothetical protein